MGRKRNPHALLLGLLLGATTMENNMEFAQKLKKRNTIQSSNFTSGYIPQENKNRNPKIYALLC